MQQLAVKTLDMKSTALTKAGHDNRHKGFTLLGMRRWHPTAKGLNLRCYRIEQHPITIKYDQIDRVH